MDDERDTQRPTRPEPLRVDRALLIDSARRARRTAAAVRNDHDASGDLLRARAERRGILPGTTES